jgi:hypothetical protein
MSQFTNVTISNNFINNIGLIFGTGYRKYIWSHNGIFIAQAGTANKVIEYNTIDNIGYNAIDFAGTNYTIQYNFISNFCLKKGDGGGIYTYDNKTGDSRSCIIQYNIILFGIGDATGTTNSKYPAVQGIYCDGNSNGITVKRNTVAYCTNDGNGGYFQNSNVDGLITDNTFYNNKEQIKISTTAIVGGDTNINIKRNIAFSKDKMQGCLYYIGNSELNPTAVL